MSDDDNARECPDCAERFESIHICEIEKDIENPYIPDSYKEEFE